MSVGIELLITEEPHLIPGYTGYCPQYRFRCGETYAKATHKLLLDRTVNHENTFILSNRVTRDCQLPRKSDIDTVNARFKRTDPIFVHPMLPGYEGFIPRLNARIGQRYTVLATEGLAEFEREQLRNKAALSQLRKTIDEQSEQSKSQNLKGCPERSWRMYDNRMAKRENFIEPNY
ncbi:UPF0605 protein CG18335-like isoform X2 [Pseudomyrmex gracilis]|uniref:UPF0605 protein CG18335-like isoform X2 n=1 Tax=Pseudomyrmex gracilis TaxID=219809 RepID=UPI000995A577|nr:UPF0605 protein CG18335-like isoform X2 [Pseudomyrmex gracilis]